MKKYWITAMLTVLAIFAIGGTISAAADTNEKVAINAADSGKQIMVNTGDSFTVTLDSNPSTGFSWSIVSIGNESVTKNTGQGFKNTDTKLVGAGGQEVWTFKATDKGTSTIEMKYSRSWEQGMEPAGTFNVTIIVK